MAPFTSMARWMLQGQWVLSESGMQALLAVTSLPSAFGSETSQAGDDNGTLLFAPQKASTEKSEKCLDERTSIGKSAGIAVIPITGPLFKTPNILSDFLGASTYVGIRNEFLSALHDTSILAIVLDIDSPGGEVHGCADLADVIYRERGRKPIVAFASGDAASGAYWLASACDRIVASETAVVGSIGVVGCFRRKALDADSVIEIVSTQSPDKRLDVETDSGRQKIQERIDALADVFIGSVARHRAVTLETVRQDFGAGGVQVGHHAVASGLIDQLQSRDVFLKTLASVSATTRGLNTAISHTQTTSLDTEKTQDTAMSHQPTASPPSDASTPPKGNAPETQSPKNSVLPSDLPTTVTVQPSANEDEKRGFLAGQKIERERIASILGDAQAKGRESLARHLALATSLPVDMAISMLMAAPRAMPLSPPTRDEQKRPPTEFEKAMARFENPVVASGLDTPEPEDAEVTALRIAQCFTSGEGR